MNENTELPQKIYIDANFLISYWVKNHENHGRACELLFKLVENDSVIFISPLVIDETWYKMRYILKKNEDKNVSFNNFYPEFRRLFEFIANYFKIIQFRNNHVIEGCRKALENVRAYNFRPHDAFHLALVEENEISAIVTIDSDFTKQRNKEQLGKRGIKIVTF